MATTRTYSNLTIAKAKGAQHHISIPHPPSNAHTHTNLSVPPSWPFISGPPLQTHERMLCGDPGENERGRKERENIKAGLCVESSWGVCAFVWGGMVRRAWPYSLPMSRGLWSLLYRTQHCINTSRHTSEAHTRGWGESRGIKTKP